MLSSELTAILRHSYSQKSRLFPFCQQHRPNILPTSRKVEEQIAQNLRGKGKWYGTVQYSIIGSPMFGNRKNDLMENATSSGQEMLAAVNCLW